MTLTLHLPAWLPAWLRSDRTGTSALTIAHVLTATTELLGTTGAPYDVTSVGRCVELLDLAEAHGEDWRSRLDEVARWCPAWAPLVPHWPAIEAAWREDAAAFAAHRRWQTHRSDGTPRTRRKTGTRPPSRCWWLVATLRGHRDPYAHLEPHPFAARRR